MLITCPSCAARYELDTAKIGPQGRKVRCSRCKTSFFANNDGTSRQDVPSSRSEDIHTGFDTALDEAHKTQMGIPLQDTHEEEAWSDINDHTVATESARIENERRQAAGRLEFSALASRPEVARLKKLQGTFARTGHWLVAPFRKLPPTLTAATLCGLVALGIYGQREAIVVRFPETARLYALAGMPVNIRGVDMKNITTTVTREGEASVLLIEGQIENVAHRTVSVPLIALSVRDKEAQALYTWSIDPPRAKLGAGETVPFQARLSSPPAEGVQVLVMFRSRQMSPASTSGGTEGLAVPKPSSGERPEHPVALPEGSHKS